MINVLLAFVKAQSAVSAFAVLGFQNPTKIVLCKRSCRCQLSGSPLCRFCYYPFWILFRPARIIFRTVPTVSRPLIPFLFWAFRVIPLPRHFSAMLQTLFWRNMPPDNPAFFSGFLFPQGSLFCRPYVIISPDLFWMSQAVAFETTRNPLQSWIITRNNLVSHKPAPY
jgi:hypothetical protein